VRVDEDQRFARVVTRFLQQECIRGAGYAIADEDLFKRFRTFWMHAAEYFDHPALLGQFRVELAERGFQSNPYGKRPRWIGLTVRE
jgi:hypothetical protein